MLRVAIKTLGCRLNQAETAQMAARFEAAGCTMVPSTLPCDICVVHSCAVTAAAERKCIAAARAVRSLAGGDRTFVVLAGCGAAIAGKRMASAARADLVVGQAAKFNLPAILQARGVMPAVAASSLRQEPVPRFNTTRALVKVQDGCSYFCSYCVVPYARGAPVSRRAHDVVQEVRGLVEAGFREFSLTGANLGLYEDGPRKLPDLLESVTGVPGVLRVRLSSIEVSTVERAVIDYLCDSPKMCSYLHLPLQSGDDRVLAAMGRRYTTAQFRRAVEYAANRAPWLGLGTDLIVGFPGEDEKAFINTLALVRELPFSNLHVFTYSKREGTRAAQLRDSVARPEKKRRSAVLIAAGEHKRLAFAERLVGCEVAVLVERVTEEGCASGWTSEYVRAELAGAAVSINTIVMFHPTSFVNGILR